MEVQTVSQLTRKIRHLLEFQIGEVWVEGEVSNHRLQTSGHQYFTLKDAHAQLSCVFFKGNARFNKTPIEGGAKLRVFGELGLYEVRGQYQLVVRQVRALGAGDLHERFEALKLRLHGEGLFDQARKQAIPKFPMRIGLVTSPTGAVVQDILSVLKRRAPWVEVDVYPARVQGDGAFLEIMDGLNYFADPHKGTKPVDTIILARGGGSLEDLWAFNEEALARVIAECPIPVVSAVGHETDYSIADFVADQRAPTPSVAAELTTPDSAELSALLAQRQRQMRALAERSIRRGQEQLDWCARRGGFLTPKRYLERLTQMLDDRQDTLETQVRGNLRARWEHVRRHAQALRVLAPTAQLRRADESLAVQKTRIKGAIKRQLESHAERLQQREKQLRALGPDQTLARGYSMVLGPEGRVVSSSADLDAGDQVKIRMRDGERSAIIEE